MDETAARARLLEERAATLGMERDLATSFEDIVDAAKDSNLDDEHDPEGSTIAAERQLIAALGHSATERLGEIDAADLARCGEVDSTSRCDGQSRPGLCNGDVHPALVGDVQLQVGAQHQRCLGCDFCHLLLS